MGGHGSGSWYRSKSRDYLDDVISIDIRRWNREGLLKPGGYFVWQWMTNEKVSASIQVWVKSESLVINYGQRVNGGDWQDVEERVHLAYTDCNYGGKRTWFRCPGCGNRAAKLFSRVPYFVCRNCSGLHYQCQSETRLDRSMRRARRFRKKIGASLNLTVPIWDKPKGMHWRTYDRLRFRAMNAERQTWNETARWLDEMRGRMAMFE